MCSLCDVIIDLVPNFIWGLGKPRLALGHGWEIPVQQEFQMLVSNVCKLIPYEVTAAKTTYDEVIWLNDDAIIYHAILPIRTNCFPIFKAQGV